MKQKINLWCAFAMAFLTVSSLSAQNSGSTNSSGGTDTASPANTAAARQAQSDDSIMSKMIDAVVVVGYGTQKRSELTGAISSVNTESIKDFSAKSLAESIGGMAAGVMVTRQDGVPGSSADIIIRGAGSTQGMSPLYVVDGIAQGAGFEFNMRDVESIEILKDAGSAAIYGSKAAGGVILIT
ncbi:MAG: TonB-dependent receptor plug domain-containing protein, partial [Bacteroidales bacterium]|nr:TonB-dependent receptor plug domain-containing protein [Bacteroidales bacterium]